MASKGRPYRTVEHQGFAILVGRGARENDELTFGIGEPCDFWLHVADYTGSHVVVENPRELSELPREVAVRAAELAAWHSKARRARGKVEVHLCRVADVRKRRGAPAGQVELLRWESLKVYPRGGGGDDEP